MTDPETETTAPGNRREELLDRAGELMAAKGYDGTSMRDIASAVGMLPGSLYYHFESKEALFLALHQRVVAVMEARVNAALAAADDSDFGPWDRLESAATAHLEGLIETGNLVAIVSPEFLGEREGISAQIRQERRRYEQTFRDLFSALDLPEGVDRTILRLHLFGALNWAPIWFDTSKGHDARTVARQIMGVFRTAYEGKRA
ncbi:MAG: TetR/AcrR family transcriptional regulator [Rhodobacterales bacterium]|nr:TetR/AcrR family transcriptional regulator [Rhodobacterales bacterium]MDX5391795.1 TetR/AcrR family transcriptional regulator [Rhodobacterales bacterium]MDX5491495.1 TetR/AcrR family transcriptional regulator [Rhodobacterales bacterium]